MTIEEFQDKLDEQFPQHLQQYLSSGDLKIVNIVTKLSSYAIITQHVTNVGDIWYTQFFRDRQKIPISLLIFYYTMIEKYDYALLESIFTYLDSNRLAYSYRKPINELKYKDILHDFELYLDTLVLELKDDF